MMKKLIVPILFIGLIAFGLFYFYKKYKIAPSLPIAQIEVIDENNTIKILKPAEGKITVIAFYASWCRDCRVELPLMQQAKAKLQNVDFLAITDEGTEKMLHFKEKFKYDFTYYSLTKPFQELGINSIPTTYILNPKGEIIYKQVGAVNWENPAIFQMLENILTK